MKNILLLIVTAILLSIGWAALHDIVRGEPILDAEYAAPAICAVAISLILTAFLRLHQRNRGIQTRTQ